MAHLKTVDFFDEISDKETPRSHLREMIVRDQAKRYFARNAFTVDDEEVSVGNEPLAALIIRCGPAQIRVLKGPGGIAPGCGESDRRLDFYNQQPCAYRCTNGQIKTARLNLLVLWEFDQNFNLADLSLALPIRGGAKCADVLCSWTERIPHPATQIAPNFAEDKEGIEDELERLLKDHENEEGQEEQA